MTKRVGHEEGATVFWGRFGRRGTRPVGHLMGTPAPDPKTEKGRALSSLSVAERALIVGIAMAVFMFADGPVWRDPFAIDRPIWLSYLTVPLLVAAVLAHNGRFRLRFFFLESLEVALLKYALSFCMAAIFWSAAERSPKRVAPARAKPAVPRVHHQPVPSEIPLAKTGALSGTVLDARGQPVVGALVYVKSGLEALTFKIPDEPVVIHNDGSGYPETAVVVHPGQALFLGSLDGQLHGATASDAEGQQVFNLPVVALGSLATGRAHRLRRSWGIVRLRCQVHRASTGEKDGFLAVLSNPFYTRSGSDGAFLLEGVPEGNLVLASVHQGLVLHEARIELRAGSRERVAWSSPPPSAGLSP